MNKDVTLNKSEIKKTRENSFDLLRIICCLAVIAIHVPLPLSESDPVARFGLLTVLPGQMLNQMSRFAVPCFLLLTGGFVLADERNSDRKFFYKKSLKKVFVPAAVFIVLYWLYRGVKAAAEGKLTLSEIKIILIDFICGYPPHFHLWYVYMLFGIYLLIPFIILLKKTVGEKPFAVISFVFLMTASISAWTSQYTVTWDIGKAFCYCGYVMVGYVIKKHFNEKKSNGKGLAFLAGAILILAVFGLSKTASNLNLADVPLSEYTDNPTMHPMIVAASLMIFAAFSCFKISLSFGKLSALTFYIYLIHAFVIDVTDTVLKKTWNIEIYNFAETLLMILFVFLVSSALSRLFGKLWSKAEEKFAISEKLCRILRLTQNSQSNK